MINHVRVVGHSQRNKFEDALNEAIHDIQRLGREAEIQYPGKFSGHYSALIIARMPS